jgi:hypothetical protein
MPLHRRHPHRRWVCLLHYESIPVLHSSSADTTVSCSLLMTATGNRDLDVGIFNHLFDKARVGKPPVQYLNIFEGVYSFIA